LWKQSLLVSGSTSVPNINVNDPGGRNSLGDEVGVTGTPVIDLSTNSMYVSAKTWENGTAVHRLHALDITNGSEKFGGPVVETATVAGTGGRQREWSNYFRADSPEPEGWFSYFQWAGFRSMGVVF